MDFSTRSKAALNLKEEKHTQKTLKRGVQTAKNHEDENRLGGNGEQFRSIGETILEEISKDSEHQDFKNIKRKMKESDAKRRQWNENRSWCHPDRIIHKESDKKLYSAVKKAWKEYEAGARRKSSRHCSSTPPSGGRSTQN